MLTLVPCTLREAHEFVRRDRHREEPALRWPVVPANEFGLEVVGVAVIGNPVARGLADGWTAEVRRVAVVDGARNACSMLYGAAWRAARALGYRLVTYTLPTESGSSLRGAGWRCLGEAGGGSWSRPNRPRVDMAPTQVKLRWEVVGG